MPQVIIRRRVRRRNVCRDEDDGRWLRRCVRVGLALASEWSVYGGVSYDMHAGQIHRNTSSYTATPHASGSVQPGRPSDFATASGGFAGKGLDFFTGGRFWIFVAELSLGLDEYKTHESRWELMAGLEPPIGWPIRFQSKYFKVIPSLVVGGGSGAMGIPTGYEGSLVRRGPYFSSALRVDLRVWKVLLRIAGQYRAMSTKSQTFLDLSDGSEVDYQFAKSGFSWDLGFNVGLGVEFPLTEEAARRSTLMMPDPNSRRRT